MKRIACHSALLILASCSIPAQAQTESNPPKRTMGIAALIGQRAVQKELNLNEEQTEAVKQAAAEFRKASQAAQSLDDVAARRKTNQEATRKLRGVIAEKLDEDQQKRFLQIELQYSNGVWILRRPELAKELKLTKEQRQKLLELAQASQKTTEKLRAGQNDDNRQETQKKVAAALSEARASALKLLTDEQKEKLKKAKGELLKLPVRRKKRE